jgi:hypothetical protein
VKVRFLFIAEGSSDRALSEHLARLCVQAGADEAQDVSPDLSLVRPAPGKSLAAYLACSLELEPQANLVFLHRDANGVGRPARLGEMTHAMESFGGGRPWVPVIPVPETEAWLLLDEQSIREVAGNPRGSDALDLPKPARIESMKEAKETLQRALALATGASGRRAHRSASDFVHQRRELVARLDLDGPVRELLSWQQLAQDLAVAVGELRRRQTRATP